MTFTADLNSEAVTRALRAFQALLAEPSPALTEIADDFRAMVTEQFASEGRAGGTPWAETRDAGAPLAEAFWSAHCPIATVPRPTRNDRRENPLSLSEFRTSGTRGTLCPQQPPPQRWECSFWFAMAFVLLTGVTCEEPRRASQGKVCQPPSRKVKTSSAFPNGSGSGGSGIGYGVSGIGYRV